MSGFKMNPDPETVVEDLQLIKANGHGIHARLDSLTMGLHQWQTESQNQWNRLENLLNQHASASSLNEQSDSIYYLLNQSQQCIELLQAMPQRIKSEPETNQAVSNDLTEDQVADSTLQEKWKFLQGYIADICQSLAETEPTTDSLPGQFMQTMRGISPYFMDYLQDVGTREFLYQAHLWRVIYRNLLHGSGRILAGSALGYYKSLRQTLIDERSEPGSSATTLQWLVDHPKAVEEYSSERVDKLVRSQTIRLCELANISDEARQAVIKERLKHCITLAIEIDTICLRLKAHIGFEYPKDCTVPHDKQCVQQVPWNLPSAEDGTPILFFIAPVLYKQGDGFGQNRHEHNALCKATFVCNDGDSKVSDLETKTRSK